MNMGDESAANCQVILDGSIRGERMKELIERINDLPGDYDDHSVVVDVGMSEQWFLDVTVADLKALAAENHRLRDALDAAVKGLREISKLEGAFSRDPLTHATNVINSIEQLAQTALARVAEIEGGK